MTRIRTRNLTIVCKFILSELPSQDLKMKYIRLFFSLDIITEIHLFIQIIP